MIRALLAAVLAIATWIALMPVFLATAVLWLFASGVRSLARLMEPRFVPWTELLTFDRELGWRPRPNLDAHYLAQADDVHHVVTDREGWQGARSLDDSAVVVVGDSFAFGYGVDAGRTFADLNPKLTIKGVGAPGYSMVQSVLLIEQLAERLSGKLVVWFICLENDLEDNLAPAMNIYRAPFVRTTGCRRERIGADGAAGSNGPGAWEIVQTHVASSPWRSSVLMQRLLPHLCVPGAVADRAYAACDYLIERAARACSRIGAQLALITIPDPTQLTEEGRQKLVRLSGQAARFDENLPDTRLAESCARYGVTFVAGKDHLSARDYKPIEALHWNPRGHRRMSEVIGRVYESYRMNGRGGAATREAVGLTMDQLRRLDRSAASSP
jgi:hypothetical protein